MSTQRIVVIVSAAAALAGLTIGSLVDNTAGAKDVPPALILPAREVPEPAVKAPGAAPTRQELCNGLDDDGNGRADEAFSSLGVKCDVMGAAGLTTPDGVTCGIWVCAANGKGVRCNEDEHPACKGGEVGAPCAELCDGSDNDCDDRVDAGRDVDGSAVDFKVGQPCGVGVGACAVSGTTVCTKDGLASACDVGEARAAEPVAEIPDDQIDNDCDGEVDEK